MKLPKIRASVDAVAVILAICLGAAVTLVMVAVLIQVIDHSQGMQTLGENTTQVLIAIIGGLIGVLGGYVGAKVQQRREDRDKEDHEA